MMREDVYQRMEPGNFEAVIFDIDGTVWDIFPTYFRALSKELKRYDIIAVEIDDLIALIRSGESFRDIIANIFRSANLEISIPDFMKAVSRIYTELEEEGVQLYPEAPHLFSKLKSKNIKIGLATDRPSSRDRIRKMCLRMGIDHYLDAVTSLLYVQRQKPAPDLLVDCAFRLATPIERCLVVGDTKNDILAAKEAGGTGIGILTGQDNYEEMMKAEPFAIIRNLTEIIAFV